MQQRRFYSGCLSHASGCFDVGLSSVLADAVRNRREITNKAMELRRTKLCRLGNFSMAWKAKRNEKQGCLSLQMNAGCKLLKELHVNCAPGCNVKHHPQHKGLGRGGRGGGGGGESSFQASQQVPDSGAGQIWMQAHVGLLLPGLPAGSRNPSA